MLGKKLKFFRKSRGLTLKDVAEKLNKEIPHFSDLETGKIKNPKDETLMQILMYGFDLSPSTAKNTIAEWRAEEAIEKASDPKKVIENINIIFKGDGNSIQNNQ